MKNQLLNITNLNVNVEDKHILQDINLTINAGETHVLMGPNGTGKSSLGYTLAGNEKYEVTSGSVILDGSDLLELDTDKRAQAGIFLSFQNPMEIPGLSVESVLKAAYEAHKGERITIFKFRKLIKKQMDILQIDQSYIERDLNVGFSGGEKKKLEMLQLLVLEPKLAILDETDSGLDVDAVRIVSKAVKLYHENCQGALLIITHSTKILEALDVDYTHVMIDGNIAQTGDSSLVEVINDNGFESFQNKQG